MPLQSPRRLPKKFNRRISPQTQLLVERRRKTHRIMRTKQLQRLFQRMFTAVRNIRGHVLRWILFVVFGVLLIASSFFLFSSFFHLKEIRVLRYDERVDIAEVQDALSTLFNRHMFFLSEYEVRSLLVQKILGVDVVETTKVYPAQLVVDVKMVPLAYRVQIRYPDEQEIPVTASGSTIDFLTKEGRYASAAGVKNTEELPLLYLNDWGVKPVSGTLIASPELLERLEQATRILIEQFGHTIGIRAIYMRAQELHIQADGVSLWFDMRDPLEQQIQRYRIFRENVPKEEIHYYIDLRLQDRIIYQ